MRGIHRWPVNSPHKGPVTRKMIPFDDVIMQWRTRTERNWLKATGQSNHQASYGALLISYGMCSLLGIYHEQVIFLGIKQIGRNKNMKYICVSHIDDIWQPSIVQHMKRTWLLSGNRCCGWKQEAMDEYLSVNRVSIGSNNGLSPIRCQAII